MVLVSVCLQMLACLWVCMLACLLVSVYACMLVSVCLQMLACLWVCILACLWVYACKCLHACECVCLYACECVCLHACECVCLHARECYACMLVCVCERLFAVCVCLFIRSPWTNTIKKKTRLKSSKQNWSRPPTARNSTERASTFSKHFNTSASYARTLVSC